LPVGVEVESPGQQQGPSPRHCTTAGNRLLDNDGEAKVEAWHWTTAGKRLQLGTRQQWRKRLPERGGDEVEVEIGDRESYLDYRRR
jgi:hypothetical protein